MVYILFHAHITLSMCYTSCYLSLVLPGMCCTSSSTNVGASLAAELTLLMTGSHHAQKQGSGVKRKREDEHDDGPGKHQSCVHDVHPDACLDLATVITSTQHISEVWGMATSQVAYRTYGQCYRLLA